MLSWLMSLILILFGGSLPVIGGPDQPELNCELPLSGTIESAWGMATTTLADGQVSLMVGSHADNWG